MAQRRCERSLPANHGRVEFVVGSCLAPRVFSGFSGLPPSTEKKIFR